VQLVAKAIAGKEHTEWRRIFVGLQGAAVGASSNDVTAAATQKAGEKTSQAVCSLTEIALDQADPNHRERPDAGPAGRRLGLPR